MSSIKELEISTGGNQNRLERCVWDILCNHLSEIPLLFPSVRKLFVWCCSKANKETCRATEVISLFPELTSLEYLLETEDRFLGHETGGFVRITQLLQLAVTRFTSVHVRLYPHFCEFKCTRKDVSVEHRDAEFTSSEMVSGPRNDGTPGTNSAQIEKIVQFFHLRSSIVPNSSTEMHVAINPILSALSYIFCDTPKLEAITFRGVWLPRHAMLKVLHTVSKTLRELCIDAHQQFCSPDDFLVVLMLDVARLVPSFRCLSVNMQLVVRHLKEKKDLRIDPSDWDVDGWRYRRFDAAWEALHAVTERCNFVLNTNTMGFLSQHELLVLLRSGAESR